MAISSTAPNYIGEVRAVIDDLRNNYLKKQQLFLQEQEQNDRLALGYAQLASQIGNNNQQIGLGYAKLQADTAQTGASKVLGVANDALARARVLGANAKAEAKADLDERKFQFDMFKEQKKLEQEQLERQRDTDSGRLMQEGMIALNSDNPAMLIEWTNKMAGSILTQKQQNDVYANAMALVNTKQKLEQDGKNIKTQPEALALVQKINSMDVTSFMPDQFASSLDNYTKQFQAIGNTDPKINDVFMSVSTDVAKRYNEYRQKEFGQTLATYLRNAENGELSGDDLSDWNKIQADFPDEATRMSSKDYSDRVKRAMYQSNKRKSIAQLQSMEEQNRKTVESLLIQNPSLAAIKQDPNTGERYKSFPFPVPDLTPNDFSIDSDTGLLTKSVLDSNKKWISEIMSPNYLFGQVPFTRGMLSNLPAPAPVEGEKNIPFRYESNSNFVSTPIPGQTTIPTAPRVVAQATIPQETVNKLVSLYQQNPNAIYNGVPVRSIIAKMQADGLISSDVLQPQQTQVVQPEKAR